MRKLIKLYLKESPYGKKYLGKTVQDPYKYNGTGVLWLKHLKKYKLKNTDIKTTVLFETLDKSEFKKVATYYSKKLDVVNNPDFCNLTVEEGQGGNTSRFIDYSKRNTVNPNPKGNKGFRKGQRWMHKGDIEVRALPEEIDEYIHQGFILGSKPGKFKGRKTSTSKKIKCPKCGELIFSRAKGPHKRVCTQEESTPTPYKTRK